MGFSDRLRRLFGKSEKRAEPAPVDEKAASEWYEHKSKLLEKTLGKEHDMVMHAIIPFAVGGGLDLYYFPNGIRGTGIATKELSELPNQGSSNSVFQSYELVMFTRHKLDLDQAKNDATPFGRAHASMNTILNIFANYSQQATLNPGDTCEFPADMEKVGGKCFIVDNYGIHNDELVSDFGILLVMEIFRSEMEFARANRGVTLIDRLKKVGHYPYSDMDRKAVA